LKAPGIKRLKLKYDGPLSNVAFKFNLRRYNQADAAKAEARLMTELHKRDEEWTKAGAYTAPLFCPT